MTAGVPIPPPTEPLVDPKTGKISDPWFRHFNYTSDITISGAVSGPASSTDNAIARWDGTGGTTLQNSSPVIDDNGQYGVGRTVTTVATATAGDLFRELVSYSYTGGTAGNVATPNYLATSVSSGVADYVWGITSVVFNNATAGQNVAAYFQGIKQNTGETWAIVCDAIDQTNTADPTKALLGIEVDIRANGTDANQKRKGVSVIGWREDTGMSAVTFTNAYEIYGDTSDFANITFTNGFYFGSATYGVGIQFKDSNATFSTGCIQLGDSKPIVWDTAAAYSSFYTTLNSVPHVAFKGTDNSTFTGIVARNHGSGASGALVLCQHETPSPAANDIPGLFGVYGRDSGNAVQEWGSLYCQATTVTGGSEVSKWVLTACNVGNPTTALEFGVGQIKFPASQNASTDANTLDDYEESTWTPTITFATAGDLSVAYTLQTGTYTKIGHRVFFDFILLTSSFTHTTASGLLRVGGLPFTQSATQFVGAGSVSMRGYTKANFTQTTLEIPAGSTTYLYISASGSGQAATELTAADMPTGGTVQLIGQGSYIASA